MAKAAESSERVAEWRGSGMTAKEFCVGCEYSAHNLLYWSSALRRRSGAEQRAGREVTLARVVRSVRSESSARTPAAIVVPTRAARVEVSPGADAATLAVVLTALGAIGGAR